MFDIGWPEMLVVAIVLIVIVGPKDLPGMLRNFGRTTSKLRSMAGDFRKQFDEALKEAELDDVKGVVDDMRKLNPAADLRKALNPMRQAAEDMRSGLDSAMKPNAHPQNAKEAAEARAAAATEAKTAETLKKGQDKPAAGNAKKAPAKKPASARPKAPPAKSKSSTAKAKPAAAKAGTARSSAVKSGTTKKAAPAKATSAKPAAKPKAAPKRSTAKASNAAAGAKKGGQAS